ncbi:MAG: DNA gyrase C-terminal beta-propeller domain-containing protein [Anaerolineae bacterium]
MEKPDLTNVSAEVLAYIEHLEGVLASTAKPKRKPPESTALSTEPTEPETTVQVITLSEAGRMKRTPRHLYARQKRAGMGVFEIDLPDDDRPKQIMLADVTSDLIVLTNFARVYKIPVENIQEAPVRGKGGLLADLLTGLGMHEREHVVTLLAGSGQSIVVLTERGHVIARNKNFIKNGAILYDVNTILPPKAACWSTGRDEIFIGTKKGLAIRFATGQVSSKGTSAIRLDAGDELLGITAVEPTGGVLLVSSEGRGTIRLMDGFRPNKSPGGGGKVALKAEEMVGMATANPEDDVFIVSSLCKMIRFNAGDIPAKTGAVQGVHLMTLRADEVVAVGVATLS